jgi:CheY-like chemotaxis protein
MPEGRILVIDDDDSIRELVAEILLDGGYDVAQARNGAQALTRLEQDGVFDLVVLDMRMPVIDGWQFASAVRESGVEVPIVVMTAAQNARRWAEEIGAAGYISKPFGIDELLAAVEEVLRPGENPTSGRDALLRWLGDWVRALDGPRTMHPAPA